MATALNGSVFVPTSRTTYYAAVNNQGNYSIIGWGAHVENVQADGNGGYNVTLSISPGIVDSTYDLNSTIFDLNYLETYNVGNGGYNYIGSTDPEGRAGQLPLIIRM